MSSIFGLDNTTYSRPTSANVIIRPVAFTASGGVKSFSVPFAVSVGNTIVTKNGLFLTPNQFTVDNPNTISVPSVVDGDVVSLVIIDEKIQTGLTRKVFYYYQAGISNWLDIGWGYTANRLSVYVDGVMKFQGTHWNPSGPTGIEFVTTPPTGSSIYIIEDIPNSASEIQAVDFTTQVTGKPSSYQASQSSVVSVLADILQSDEAGKGADFIFYDDQKSIKEEIDEILVTLDTKTTIDYPVVNKDGDTGLGVMVGDEWRLTEKGQSLRLFYTGPSDNAGIRANPAGEIEFVQGAGANNNAKFRIGSTDVWHREMGFFKDFFFPKTGFAYNGVGSYQLYLDEPLEGSTLTPPGQVGTWRCMSVVNRGRANRMALLLRIA